MPVMPGIFQSSRIMSGVPVSARWRSAAGPSGNEVIAKPASDRFCARDSRNIPSSSTITIRLDVIVSGRSWFIVFSYHYAAHAGAGIGRHFAAAVLKVIFQYTEHLCFNIGIEKKLQCTIGVISPYHGQRAILDVVGLPQ